MAEYLQVTVDSGAQVFICNPRSAWQRGTEEHRRGCDGTKHALSTKGWPHDAVIRQALGQVGTATPPGAGRRL
jgi:hypothetical protein